MRSDIQQGFLNGVSLARAAKDSATSLRADLLAVEIEQAIATARERSERWDGVFEERFDVTDQFAGPLNAG